MTKDRQLFGVELNRRRVRAGLSLAELSELVHYHRAHLSRVENGHRGPSAQLARMADAALDADGALMAIAALETAERPGHAPPTAVHEPIEALTAWTGEPESETSLRDFEGEAIAAVFDDGLDRIRDVGQRLTPPTVLRLLRHQLRALWSFLEPAPEPGRRLLLRTAARYAEYAGWMAQESGDEASTIQWTDRAVKLATAGGEPTMAAYGLVRIALVALHRGDAETTVRLARDAQRCPDLPDRVLGLAVMRESQGLALAGEYTEFRRGMDRAAELVENAPAAGFGTSSLANPVPMATGWSMLHAGRPAEGARMIEAALPLIADGAVRSRTRWAARCALEHAAAGEVERSCELALEVLPAAAVTSSAAVTADLRALGGTLGRRRSDPRVKPVLVEINAALHQAVAA